MIFTPWALGLFDSCDSARWSYSGLIIARVNDDHERAGFSARYYSMTYEIFVLLLPFHNAFRMTAWCTGFAMGADRGN
jgi:hypothetical protein